MRAVGRLAIASLRARPGSAVLVGVVFAAVAATAGSAVAVDDAAARAWDRTFERTHAAHLRILAASPEAALELASSIPGVVERSEPWNTAFTQLRAGGRVVALALLVRNADVIIDRPVPVDGQALGGPGLFIERSFATALALRPSDVVEVRRADGSWAPTKVGGIAASVVAGPYPSTVPGRAFVTPDVAAALGVAAGPGATVGLRLRDGADAARVAGQVGISPDNAMVTDWSTERNDALSGVTDFQVILSAFAFLLLGTAASVLAATIGGRVVAEQRQLGLLRAAGCTPLQASCALMLEYGVVAAAGAAAGAALAAAVLPALACAALPPLGMPPGGMDLRTAVAVALSVTSASALVAAAASWRATRRRPATLLQGEPFERHSGLGRRAVQRGAPVVFALGVKDAFTRRARALTTAGAVALAVMAVVAALSMEATFDRAAEAEERGVTQPIPSTGPTGGSLPPIIGEEATINDGRRLRPLVYTLEGALVATALVTLLVSVLLDGRERRQEQAMLKAIGVTPLQLSLSRGIAGGVVAAAGAVLGLPLGWAFFRAAYASADGSPSEVGDASLLGALVAAGVVCMVAITISTLAGARAAGSAPVRALAVD